MFSNELEARKEVMESNLLMLYESRIKNTI